VQICLEAGLDSTVAVSTLGSGKALGWSAVLGRLAYSGTARTVEPSSLIATPAAPLRRMMLEDKELAVALLTAIGRMTAARLDDTRYQLVGVMGHPGEPGDTAPAG
jgi:CRP-like cAMP-binding protein